MGGSIFKLVYFIELVLISVVRSVSTSRYRKLETVEDRTNRLDLVMLALSGVGMIMPLFYVFSPWLDFADFSLPDWLGWVGAVMFAGAAVLLWLTHQALGRNWTPTLGIRQEHTLVTEGVFRYIRHPMYAAHLLWALAQPLLLHNWIAGFSFLAVSVPHYLLRVGDEEQMMLDNFGEEYREYMEQTGSFFPHLFR
jgi:protein-S-isoprenylcysteine O-methyltransferase Ste14